MKRHIQLTILALAAISLASLAQLAWAKTKVDAQADAKVAAKEVEMFAGMESGELDVKIIARSDRDARVIIANKTNQPLNIKLPEAFAAVPVAAQFGGGGGGGFGGGGRGGGMFSIPAEDTAKIDVKTVCLDHGLRNPSSSKPYKIVPADSHVKNPAVVELLKAYGRGELEDGAAQAAAWNLNSNMPWNALAAKLTGTERNFNRSPYFSAAQIRAGMAYSAEANRRAEEAAAEKEATKENEQAEPTTDENSSEARSTVDYTAE